MKIKITHQPPDEVQRFFSTPLTLAQRLTVKMLLLEERVIRLMKKIGLNRS